MADPNPWDAISTPETRSDAPARAPAATSNPWDAISTPETRSDAEPQADLSKGFLQRSLEGFRKVPRDIVDEFMHGLHTTLAAPGQMIGIGDQAPTGIDENIRPNIEKQLLAAGETASRAKMRTDDIMRSMQRQQGMNGLLVGPMQMVLSVPFGAYRSFITRPLEESGGPPMSVSETATMVGLSILGIRGQMHRLKVSAEGEVSSRPIGDPPQRIDFKTAADTIIEGEFTVIEPPLGLPSPAPKQLPGPPKKTEPPAPKANHAVVEENLKTLWQEEGIHPAEAVAEARVDPGLRDVILAPPPPTTVRGFIDTRGSGAQFTGHRAPIVLDEGFYGSSTSYYGTTSLYTTDAFDVAAGYANRRGATAPTIYQVRPPENAKIYDMELPIVPEVRAQIDQMALDPYGDTAALVEAALAENPKNLREFFDAVREQAASDRIPADEVQEGVFHPIADFLSSQGFHGMSHKGGLITKTPEHNVTLYFDPYKNVELHAIDPTLFKPPEPTPKQAIAEVDAGYGEPPRLPALSPDGLPRYMYPQAAAAAAQQAGPQAVQAGGGAQPPRAPPTAVGPATPPGGGGLPPPPPQGPPPQPIPPQPPPYFTYDDRSGFTKAFHAFVAGWQKTFQPELVSDLALQADPRFAKYKAASQNLKDQIVHNQEADYQFWRRIPESDRLRYLQGFERGQVPAGWQQRATTHKAIMDRVHMLEAQAGSRADYFENYFPHIWQDPQQARVWAAGRAAQEGSTWFQKERTFQAIREGMAAGLRLKDSNPEFLITQRLFAAVDMLERMDLLKDMKGMGLGIPVAEARAQREQRIQIAKQLGFPIDVTTIGRDLSHEGWELIKAPTGEEWFIAPDIRPLWQNAMQAKGLWGNETWMGTGFRGYMAFKNVWVPIKLGLSLFHPIHVAHINMTQHVLQALAEATRGNYGEALRSLGDIVYDPIAAAIPKLTHEGRFARQAWLVPEDQRTPLEKMVVQAMQEGGLVANISEQLKIDGQRALETAWDNSQWLKLAPQLVRAGIQKIGKPIFEEWIPNLKVSAYLRGVADFSMQHPAIVADPVQRSIAFRAIAKETENRYGEMFYGGMFWNRMLKDVGIGALISLGWQAGFIRTGVGAAVLPIARAVRSTYRAPTQSEQTIFHAQNKGAYVMTYAISAFLINGIITYASTGEDPEGMDWVFPRIGRNNPDGTPHRLTNAFYTREVPMLQKNIEHAGSVLGGVADTLSHKLVVGPFVDGFKNRDYFGNEVWSEDSPLYKQGLQLAWYLFGEQSMPMSVTGAKQAMKQGGGYDEAAMALLGFGPAPSYANKSSIQNEISGLFQRYVAPEVRPHEMGKKATDRRDIASELLQAQTRRDEAAVRTLSQKFLNTGGTPQGLTNLLLHIPPDIGQFRALPEEIQQRVMSRASPEEAHRYRPYLKSDVSARVADLQVEAAQAMSVGDRARADALTGQIHTIFSEAVHSGKITDLRQFQQSVQKHMMFRLTPQAAAEKADRPRQKKLMLQPALQ